ncbi:MAG: lipocalin family protein [Chitinophagaceae bacterium]|nr:lipocalin family protein [Bacteroidota bacterium]MCC6258729.1 lipocalin family protein [Chitinophagaceae bacterium]MCW5917274.1 lipocalin family protein [Ferruginibacter sp.]
MKTNHLLFVLAVFVSSITILSGCKKDEVPASHAVPVNIDTPEFGQEGLILGKWRVVKSEVHIMNSDKEESTVQLGRPDDFFNFDKKEIFSRGKDGFVENGFWKIVGQKLHLYLPKPAADIQEVYDIQVLNQTKLVLYNYKDDGVQVTETSISLLR